MGWVRLSFGFGFAKGLVVFWLEVGWRVAGDRLFLFAWVLLGFGLGLLGVLAGVWAWILLGVGWGFAWVWLGGLARVWLGLCFDFASVWLFFVVALGPLVLGLVCLALGPWSFGPWSLVLGPWLLLEAQCVCARRGATYLKALVFGLLFFFCRVLAGGLLGFGWGVGWVLAGVQCWFCLGLAVVFAKVWPEFCCGFARVLLWVWLGFCSGFVEEGCSKRPGRRGTPSPHFGWVLIVFVRLGGCC